MARHIEEQVIRGEIDNRTPGRVVGKLWLLGRDEPVELDLEGNPWRDLAGHVLKFTNPDPMPDPGLNLASIQVGMVGNMTAARKVKIPDCSMEELMECASTNQPFPWHWGNSLHLEWYSQTNGHVVIESIDYQLELDAEPTWTLTEEEEIAQQAVNSNALAKFMDGVGIEIANSPELDELDDDLPQSLEEAQADAEDARMQSLIDRVTARLDRGEFNIEKYDQILNQERKRMMQERGERDPEFNSERQQWIDEMNATADEALVDLEAEKWKGPERDEEERHPLEIQCTDFAVALYHEIHNAGWLAEDAHEEHPLWEIQNGVSYASAKLAGALCMACRYDEWPPEHSIAGHVIVRLKKARGYLRDALNGLDCADEEALATPQWRQQTRLKFLDILAQTQVLLHEAREVLGLPNSDEDLGVF